MIKKPPSWNDESAVARLVAAELEELRLEVDRWAWTSPPWEQFPTEPEDLVEMGKLVERENRWPDEEEQACEAALRGDLMPLVNLLTPEIFEDIGINEVNRKIRFLKPATRTLVVEFLAGKRNLRTGRLRGEPGRPAMAEEMRRKHNPVHDAADELPVIAAILTRLYPAVAKKAVKERALTIAAGRKGANPASLTRHLSRPASDRRRIK
jgi:hypothetical protein